MARFARYPVLFVLAYNSPSEQNSEEEKIPLVPGPPSDGIGQ